VHAGAVFTAVHAVTYFFRTCCCSAMRSDLLIQREICTTANQRQVCVCCCCCHPSFLLSWPYLHVLPHSVALQSLLSLDLGVCSPGICLKHLTKLTALRTDKLFSLEPGGEAGELVLQWLEGSPPYFFRSNADQHLYILTSAMDTLDTKGSIPAWRVML
jgi:hypothetical protein